MPSATTPPSADVLSRQVKVEKMRSASKDSSRPKRNTRPNQFLQSLEDVAQDRKRARPPVLSGAPRKVRRGTEGQPLPNGPARSGRGGTTIASATPVPNESQPNAATQSCNLALAVQEPTVAAHTTATAQTTPTASGKPAAGERDGRRSKSQRSSSSRSPELDASAVASQLSALGLEIADTPQEAADPGGAVDPTSGSAPGMTAPALGSVQTSDTNRNENGEGGRGLHGWAACMSVIAAITVIAAIGAKE